MGPSADSSGCLATSGSIRKTLLPLTAAGAGTSSIPLPLCLGGKAVALQCFLDCDSIQRPLAACFDGGLLCMR